MAIDSRDQHNRLNPRERIRPWRDPSPRSAHVVSADNESCTLSPKDRSAPRGVIENSNRARSILAHCSASRLRRRAQRGPAQADAASGSRQRRPQSGLPCRRDNERRCGGRRPGPIPRCTRQAKSHCRVTDWSGALRRLRRAWRRPTQTGLRSASAKQRSRPPVNPNAPHGPGPQPALLLCRLGGYDRAASASKLPRAEGELQRHGQRARQATPVSGEQKREAAHPWGRSSARVRGTVQALLPHGRASLARSRDDIPQRRPNGLRPLGGGC